MRILARVVIVLAATAAFGVALSTPAQAAWSDCQLGYLCLFNDRNGGGSILRIPPQARGSCYNVPSNFNDITDSAWNRYNGGTGNKRYVYFYRDANCFGHTLHRDGDCAAGPWGQGVSVAEFYRPPTIYRPNTGCPPGHEDTQYHSFWGVYTDVNSLTSVWTTYGYN